MIPACRAVISYTWAPGTRQVGRVVIVTLPQGEAVVDRERRAKPVYVREVEGRPEPTFTYGAVDSKWMQGGLADTPAALFGDMLLAEGFASWEYMRDALLAFAEIEECEWARQIATQATALRLSDQHDRSVV